MNDMKKILVPCDFSDHAIQAYKFAMDTATISGGEVLVLRVFDLPFLYESAFGMQSSWHDPNLILKLEDEFRRNYEMLKNMYAEVSAPVSLLIERGPVTLTILRVIEEQQIDLVIMGTQGAGQGLLIGTNTQRIVRLSPVPVISLRKSGDVYAIKNIVLPITLQLDQTEFISKVKSLQNFCKARLHILLINTPFNFRDDKIATEALDEFVKHYKLKDFVLKIRNEMFEHEGIVSYATEVKADMIAMGTHGRKNISHVLYGSIAEDVVNSALCPVWTSTLKT
jgi:nucleotide-binding universal stress UspA family protein